MAAVRVFLDFDGVLRREDSPRSRLDADCVERFEATLAAHPEARVVIASTWRLVHPLEALRRHFSPAFAGRIEGVTPNLVDDEEHLRHAEVLAYLERNRLAGARWIAVDDDADQYRPGAPLIRVEASRGFDAPCGEALADWLLRAS